MGLFHAKSMITTNDFDFEIIVKFSYLDEDIPRQASYGVYISQLGARHDLKLKENCLFNNGHKQQSETVMADSCFIFLLCLHH